MKFKPVRSLAVLIAVLMIFMALPAVPASAADVTSITIQLAEEMSDVAFFDGNKTYDGAYSDANNDGHYHYTDTIEKIISDSSGKQEFRIGTIDYELNASSSNITLNRSGSVKIGSVLLGIRFKASSSSSITKVNVKVAVGSTSKNDSFDVTKNGDYYEGKYTVNLSGRSDFSAADGSEATMTYSFPAPTYTVTMPAESGGFTLDKQGEQKVEEGSTFEFTVTMDNESSVPVVTLRSDSPFEVLKPQAGSEDAVYKYKIDDVRKNYRVTIEVKDALVVTMPHSGVGFTASAKSYTIPYGSQEAYTFTVTPTNGYKVTVTASTKGAPLSVTSEGETYTITAPGGGFVDPVTVNITAELEKHSVKLAPESFASNKAYTSTFVEQTGITYGGSYQFTITPNDGYDAPEVNISGIASDNLSISGTTYTISNITADVTVTITPKAINKYTVTLPLEQQRIGYKIEVKNGDVPVDGSVDYGTKVTITLTVDEAYSNSSVTLSVGGEVLVATKHDGNVYTYEYTVRRDVSVSVTGITKNRYTVTVPSPNETYSVQGTTQTVDYGTPFSFSITLEAGYEFTGDMQTGLFSLGAEQKDEYTVTKSGNVYTVTINSVTGNMTFSVKDEIKKITLKVTVPQNLEGVNFSVSEPSQAGEDGTYSVEYGGSFTFKAEAKTGEGYKIESISYTMGGAPTTLKLDSSNSYTISNITAAVVITIEVSQSFKVTLPESNEGYTVSYTGESPVTVLKNGSVTFTVTLTEGYGFDGSYGFALGDNCIVNNVTGGTLAVRLNDNNSATYTISGITANIDVTIKESVVKALTFTVTAPKEKNGYELKFGEETVDSKTVGYNAQVEFSVTPNKGYRIVEVVSVINGIRNTILKTGDVYRISDIKNDCTIEVTCRAITITVNYNYKAVEEYGITFEEATTKTETYDVSKNEDGRFDTNGTWTLNLKTPETREGYTFVRFLVEGQQRSTISLSDVTDDKSFNVDVEWKLAVNGAGEFEDSKQNEALGVQGSSIVYSKETGSVGVQGSMKAIQGVQDALASEGDVEFVAFGMLYATLNIATYEQYLEETIINLKEKGYINVGGLSSSSSGGIYSYYHEVAGTTFDDTYTQKVTVKQADSEQSRWACVWFKLRINGEDHVFFGEVYNIQYDVNNA